MYVCKKYCTAHQHALTRAQAATPHQSISAVQKPPLPTKCEQESVLIPPNGCINKWCMAASIGREILLAIVASYRHINIMCNVRVMCKPLGGSEPPPRYRSCSVLKWADRGVPNDMHVCSGWAGKPCDSRMADASRTQCSCQNIIMILLKWRILNALVNRQHHHDTLYSSARSSLPSPLHTWKNHK